MVLPGGWREAATEGRRRGDQRTRIVSHHREREKRGTHGNTWGGTPWRRASHQPECTEGLFTNMRLETNKADARVLEFVT